MACEIAFVGNAVAASGYRLAGIAVYVPEPGGETAAFERAREAARVVLVALDTALAMPLARLEAAIADPSRLVLVVPDPGGRPAPVDPAARVRRQLGLEG